eukprot:2972539-Amphidinium_carterae.1
MDLGGLCGFQMFVLATASGIFFAICFMASSQHSARDSSVKSEDGASCEEVEDLTTSSVCAVAG